MGGSTFGEFLRLVADLRSADMLDRTAQWLGLLRDAGCVGEAQPARRWVPRLFCNRFVAQSSEAAPGFARAGCCETLKNRSPVLHGCAWTAGLSCPNRPMHHLQPLRWPVPPSPPNFPPMRDSQAAGWVQIWGAGCGDRGVECHHARDHKDAADAGAEPWSIHGAARWTRGARTRRENTPSLAFHRKFTTPLQQGYQADAAGG